MKDLLSSVSLKGQVTIPMEIRRALDIKPRDKVAFRLEHGELRIVPAAASVQASFQAVPPLRQPLTDEQIIEIASEEHAHHVAKEGR
jgi:AbrB family looped-hinge helix DNA binding protein